MNNFNGKVRHVYALQVNKEKFIQFLIIVYFNVTTFFVQSEFRKVMSSTVSNWDTYVPTQGDSV